jgi:hypothetical protein
MLVERPQAPWSAAEGTRMALTLGLALAVWIVAAVLVRVAFGRAPVAYEDANGFHVVGDEPRPGRVVRRTMPPLRELQTGS